jgi:restriction system protein
VSTNSPTDMLAAFEMLLEEIEEEVDLVEKAGTRAIEEHNYDNVSKAIDRAKQITAFRDKVLSLRDEWEALTIEYVSSVSSAMLVERRSKDRLQRGLRTPEAFFYQPILIVLSELGGSAKIDHVLTKLEASIKGELKSVDYEILSSDPEMPRWRKTAQWARYAMVKKGFLKSDSPRGTWEITEAGRKFLVKGSQ